MKKFSLKRDDVVYSTTVYTDRILNKTKPHKVKVAHFQCGHIFYIDHPYLNSHPFSIGLFYGFGYSHWKNCYHIVTKKKWQLYLALAVEKIRLMLSQKIAKKLKLQ